MPSYLLEEKYSIRKVLYSDERFQCYLANKKEENTKYFVINELIDRTLINRYIQEVISIEQKRLPEFEEYFTKDSHLYVVFSYAIGETLYKMIQEKELAFSYRLTLAKEIIYRLTEYSTISNFLKTTALFPENIVIEENTLKINFCFFFTEEDLTRKEYVYQQAQNLLHFLFQQEELEKQTPLRIILEKGEKGIYHSFGEILKDFELVLESLEKDKGLQEAIQLKKQKLKKLYQKMGVLIAVVAICIFGYQKWETSQQEQAVYMDMEKIGTVDIVEIAEETEPIETIHISKEKPKEEKAVEMEKEEVQEKEVVSQASLPKEEDGWLVDENGRRYKIYQVHRGENLTRIVKNFYGKATYADVLEVARYNDLENPSLLGVLQEIKLPEKEGI